MVTEFRPPHGSTLKALVVAVPAAPHRRVLSAVIIGVKMEVVVPASAAPVRSVFAVTGHGTRCLKPTDESSTTDG